METIIIDNDGTPLINLPPLRRAFESNGKVYVLWGETPDNWSADFEFNEETGQWETVATNEGL